MVIVCTPPSCEEEKTLLPHSANFQNPDPPSYFPPLATGPPSYFPPLATTPNQLTITFPQIGPPSPQIVSSSWSPPGSPENGNDVVFLAGFEHDTWRLTGNRKLLAEANPYFKAMLCGPMAQGGDVVVVNDVDKRAFEQVLRYLYQKSIKLQSVSTARFTLEAAHKYICPGLVKICVVYLDFNMNPSNVLEIFQDLRFFRNSTTLPLSRHQRPTAPSLELLEDREYNNISGDSTNDAAILMGEYCNALLYNCLLLIDESSEEILQQERFEELSFEDLEIITARDTLNLRKSSESVLFHAIHRWCLCECKRRKRDLTSANKRQVLGDISYCVRYLLMDETEFRSGPQKSELLDAVECELILGYIKKEQRIMTQLLSVSQQDMLTKFRTPRLVLRSDPVHLSPRSERVSFVPSIDETKDNDQNVKLSKKEAKLLKKKKKQEKKMESQKSGCCTCSCFGDGLLSVFLCLFD